MSDRRDNQTVEVETTTSDLGDKTKTTTIRLTNHYEMLYQLGISALKQSPVIFLLAFLCYLGATAIPAALSGLKESNLAVQEAAYQHDQVIRKEMQARYDASRLLAEERHKATINLIESQQKQNERAIEMLEDLIRQMDRGQRRTEAIERKMVDP